MKRTTLSFILALGLAAPGFAYAADVSDNSNAAYERDLATWNGDGQNVKFVRFEYDEIYGRDLAQTQNAYGFKLAKAHAPEHG